MNDLLHHIQSLLHAGESIALATILNRKGSTPRLPGAQMVVRSDGSIIGTIGGGIVEAEIMKTAHEVLATSEVQIRSFDLTSNAVTASVDMICGGAVDILVEEIEPTAVNREIFKQRSAAGVDGHKRYVVTDLGAEQTGPDKISRTLVDDGAVLVGAFPYPVQWLKVLTNEKSTDGLPNVVTIEGRSFFVEPLAAVETVYLFGAGHVSQKVAELALFVQFSVIVLDDREEFANRRRFPQADEITVVPSFTAAFDNLTITEGSYLVIVTRGHAHDKTVLAQALKTDARYIGMIGSRKKRDAIYEALLQEGFTQQDIGRVHCPIGLKIGGETPEEIAVSIVAELIKARTARGTSREK